MTRVIDYAWGRPSIAALKAAGAIAVCRYLAYPGPSTDGKRLSPTEATGLVGGGIAIVSNWEQAGSWAEYSGGYNTGAQHAREAARQHTQCGGPADRPIYFSTDFDATSAQLPTVADYYRGVASVIGLNRTGAYGGYRTIKYLFDRGVIRWGWQTFAWSTFSDTAGGASFLHWDSRAQLRQVRNGVTVDGVDCDFDESMTADFGQWGGRDTDMSTPFAADNADSALFALLQRLKQYQVHAAGTDPGLTTLNNQLEVLLGKLERFLDNPSAPVLTDAQVAVMARQVVVALEPRLVTIETKLNAVAAEVHILRNAERAAAEVEAAGLADPPRI